MRGLKLKSQLCKYSLSKKHIKSTNVGGSNADTIETLSNCLYILSLKMEPDSFNANSNSDLNSDFEQNTWY